MKRKTTALLTAAVLLLMFFPACDTSSQQPPDITYPSDGAPSETAVQSPSPSPDGSPAPAETPDGPTPDDPSPAEPDITDFPSPPDGPVEPLPTLPENPAPTEPASGTTPTPAQTPAAGTPTPAGQTPAGQTPEPSPEQPSPEVPSPPPAQVPNPRSAYSIPVPSQPGTLVEENEHAVLDYSNTKDGYVSAKFIGTTENSPRVRITTPKGTQYVYTLQKDGKYEIYPLTEGNGNYDIDVLEMVPGTNQAARILPQVSVNVSMTDEFAPFLRPNQYVNYTKDSQAVKKAAELVKYSQSIAEEIEAVYTYLTEHIAYDTAKANSVTTGYLPSVDATLRDGKGICFDYASLMTAMLRSRGIPTKLEIGYAGTVYHAWVRVYSKDSGWVDAVQISANKWQLLDPTFGASMGDADMAKYIGNGSNYIISYIR